MNTETSKENNYFTKYIRFSGGKNYIQSRFISQPGVPETKIDPSLFLEVGHAQRIIDTILRIQKTYSMLMHALIACQQSYPMPFSQLPFGITHPGQKWELFANRNLQLNSYLTQMRSYVDFLQNSRNIWKENNSIEKCLKELEAMKIQHPFFSVIWAIRNFAQHEDISMGTLRYDYSSNEGKPQHGIKWEVSVVEFLNSPFWMENDKRQNIQKVLFGHLAAKESIDILEYQIESFKYLRNLYLKICQYAKHDMQKAEISIRKTRDQYLRICEIYNPKHPFNPLLLDTAKLVAVNKKTGHSEQVLLLFENFILIDYLRRNNASLGESILAKSSEMRNSAGVIRFTEES